jgi:hypothetical protein
MGFYALDAAVRIEHTDMVKLLVAAGADLGGVYGESLLKSASSPGLDSMVEII